MAVTHERTNEPKLVAYLLYGERHEYERELAFSALSALRYLRDDPRGVRLCVLTDHPRLQFDLGLSQIPIAPRELAEWTRGGRCNHRAKPLALRKALAEEHGSVALVDTDTYFTDHPAKLFDGVQPGASVMHAREYALGDSALWSPLVAAEERELAGYRLAADTPMFNSGVIGLHWQDRALLDDAVALLDELDDQTSIFNAEQLAIGTVLRQHTELGTTEHLVRHYWGFKRGFVHLQIGRLLRGFRPERAHELAKAAADAELGPPKRRLADRVKSRLKARLHGWDRDCRFGYLAFLSALSWARWDREIANVWLETALEALTIASHEADTAPQRRATARQAFQLRAARWIDPRLARRWREFWAR
jgi:hypothetical protein